jgi:small subunit ribosomal protein S21
MVKVVVGERESIDHAIGRFRRKCERAGILRQLRKSAYFVKPSEKRRLRKAKAIRRSLRIQTKTV